MDLSGIIFFVIIIGLLFFCCGLCMQTKDKGAIFSSPVVITGQSHQPADQSGVIQQPYPMQTQINTTSGQHVYNPVPTTTPYPTGPSMMPVPQLPGNEPPYPTGYPPYPTSNSPYPPNPTTYPPNPTTYPPNPTTYPPNPTTYPPVNPSAPYPNAPYPPQAAMNPPSYNEVVGKPSYEKQSPYNPNFSG
jgi:hypothetical protein